VNNSSATDGAAVIQTALDSFGAVTILINNAGILRDKGQALSSSYLPTLLTANRFKNMSDQEWDQIVDVHLKGSYACSKAAWPHFRKQKFGRIINTASAAGLYGTVKISATSLSWNDFSSTGNFGQANYSAAKMGLIGFTTTLAKEGAKYNIKATVIAPVWFLFPSSS
jgi:multifunctional beta-oxidation protein